MSDSNIRCKHLVLQEMLVKEMFYCFSPVTLFFFLMNSQIYNFITRLVMPWWQGKYSRGQIRSSLKADVRVPHQKESIDPLISVHIVQLIHYFNFILSQTLLLLQILQIRTSSGDLCPFEVAKWMISNSSLPISPQSTSLGCTQALVTWR